MRYRETGDDGAGRWWSGHPPDQTGARRDDGRARDASSSAVQLVEDTFDWYAQDRRGNVWYFGENTKEYENGQV